MINPLFFRFLFILVFFGQGKIIHGQNGMQLNAHNAQLSPLEVVHNLDDILHSTRLEAMQSGRLDDYLSYLNVAKSFVHAERYTEAQTAYLETVGMVWGNDDKRQLIAQLERELKRADVRLINQERPAGLDENYQPVNSGSRTTIEFERSYTPQTAGNKIDEMMQFMVDAVYREQAEKLTLIGALSDCRHLIEMETYDAARKAYHQSIIAYLDPKWTGALLEDIDLVIERTEPFMTPSEVHPELILSQQQVLAEMKSLMLPILTYYEGNLPLEDGTNRFFQRIAEGQLEGSFELLERTLQPFAPAQWIDGRIERMRMILRRTQPSQLTVKESRETAGIQPESVSYHQEHMEGRVVESLKLKESNENMTYKKVTHRWGGIYYFINDEPSKDTEWLRVWKHYQRQEGKTETKLSSPTVRAY